MLDKILLWYVKNIPHHRGKKKLIRFADRFRLHKGIQKISRGGITWLIDTADLIQWHLFYYGSYEPEETQWMKQYIQPGMVVFDVGANIGYYTILLSKLVGENGAVHSFEAAPTTFNRLKEHMRINLCTNIRVHQLAVSDKNGECMIYCAEDSNTGESRLEGFDGFKNKESVSCITLDSYFQKEPVNKVDFIKIDVEGAEMLVINGALSLLNNQRPTVMLEINPLFLSRMGSDVTTLIATIKNIGYNMFHFHQGTLDPCNDINVSLKGKENINVVFISQ